MWNSSTSLIYASGLFRTTTLVAIGTLKEHPTRHAADQMLTCILWIITEFGYIIFTCMMIQITRSITSSQTIYKEMLLQLMQYMRHKQLSSHTQERLVAYCEFRFQKSFFREQEIMESISGQLRQEILMIKCLKLVENVPFFKGLPQSLLMQIVLCLQREIFLINDIIFKAKTKGTSMYFIGSGTVAIYTDTGEEIMHVHDGQHFGEVEIVRKDMIRISSTIAIEPCELYRLDRKDFVEIVGRYPDLMSSIEQIAFERVYQIMSVRDKHYHFYNEKRKFRRHF